MPEHSGNGQGDCRDKWGDARGDNRPGKAEDGLNVSIPVSSIQIQGTPARVQSSFHMAAFQGGVPHNMQTQRGCNSSNAFAKEAWVSRPTSR